MFNNRYLWMFLIITTLAASCSFPDVRFLVPQPVNKRDLKIIPHKYQGQYICNSDSSLLTIEADIVFQEWISFRKFPISEMYDELDSIYYEDTELVMDANWTMTIAIDNDSVTVMDYDIDTVFVHNEANKIRRYKGLLFLNKCYSDSIWSVKIMKIDNEQLGLQNLVCFEDIDTIKELTFVITQKDTATNEPLHYILEPSRKELKEILGVKELEYRFIRIIEN